MADKASVPTLYDLISQLIDLVLKDRVVAAPGGGLVESRTPGGRSLSLASSPQKTALARSNSSGVPAMAGDVPGSAPVTLYTFDGATVAPGFSVLAHNVSSRPVAPGRFLLLGQVGDYWYVTVEACGP